MQYVVGILIGLLAGFAGAWLLVSFFTDSKLAAARRTRNLLLDEARREADALRRESDLAAKEEAARVRSETERDLDGRRAQMLEREQQAGLADADVILANDFRGNPRQITTIVKAVQTLQYLIRDPFGSARAVTKP